MADRRWRRLLPLLGLGLLVASALVWASIRDLPLVQLGLALGFALAGYLAILGSDVLALRYLKVRVRFYAAWGLLYGEVMSMTARAGTLLLLYAACGDGQPDDPRIRAAGPVDRSRRTYRLGRGDRSRVSRQPHRPGGVSRLQLRRPREQERHPRPRADRAGAADHRRIAHRRLALLEPDCQTARPRDPSRLGTVLRVGD